MLLRIPLFSLFTCWVLILSGCAGPIVQPTTEARLGYQTKAHKDLTGLPEPKGKIIVAVYKFSDQTGQYKPNATSTSFSTSVTQGATSMLIEALRDSKWFVPVEREGLNNLLTERKIIMAKLKGEGQEESMPKLLHAPIILEGGIISYESNVSTGGLGARYLGVGGSTQYQKDQVGLYLRAVDVNRGEILLSVSTTKSILSQEVQFGIFKFIEVDEILESELGYTRNEPPQLCVLEAIEKAVVSMIIEGIFDRKWELKNPEQMNNPVIKKYLEERGIENPQEQIDSYLQAASRRAPIMKIGNVPDRPHDTDSKEMGKIHIADMIAMTDTANNTADPQKADFNKAYWNLAAYLGNIARKRSDSVIVARNENY